MCFCTLAKVVKIEIPFFREIESLFSLKAIQSSAIFHLPVFELQ